MFLGNWRWAPFEQNHVLQALYSSHGPLWLKGELTLETFSPIDKEDPPFALMRTIEKVIME